MLDLGCYSRPGSASDHPGITGESTNKVYWSPQSLIIKYHSLSYSLGIPTAMETNNIRYFEDTKYRSSTNLFFFEKKIFFGSLKVGNFKAGYIFLLIKGTLMQI